MHLFLTSYSGYVILRLLFLLTIEGSQILRLVRQVVRLRMTTPAFIMIVVTETPKGQGPACMGGLGCSFIRLKVIIHRKDIFVKPYDFLHKRLCIDHRLIFFRFLFEEKAPKSRQRRIRLYGFTCGGGRTFAAPLLRCQITRCLNVLITKYGKRRQNIFNGIFCRAAALMRTGTPPLSEAA